jgi:signal transduction histidine kinase
MEVLIKSLLDSASIEAGRFSVTRAPCDVEQAMQAAMEMLGVLAAPKSIQLELHLKQPRLGVLADYDRVIEVLTNLVGNALKFSPEGGKVEMTAERDGENVRFSVSDTGPGIAHDHLPHVFDRFWKAETGGKRGTGLGLYIAKGIVEAHGGRIWVESQIGHGATFHFTLLFTDERPSPREGQTDGPAEPRPALSMSSASGTPFKESLGGARSCR